MNYSLRINFIQVFIFFRKQLHLSRLIINSNRKSKLRMNSMKMYYV